MQNLSRFLLLTSVALLSACGSKGPGEIGSLDDIVVRNAGDPPLSAMKVASQSEGEEPQDISEEDPIAQHQKAVDGVDPELKEEAPEEAEIAEVVPPEAVEAPAEPETLAEEVEAVEEIAPQITDENITETTIPKATRTDVMVQEEVSAPAAPAVQEVVKERVAAPIPIEVPEEKAMMEETVMEEAVSQMEDEKDSFIPVKPARGLPKAPYYPNQQTTPEPQKIVQEKVDVFEAEVVESEVVETEIIEVVQEAVTEEVVQPVADIIPVEVPVEAPVSAPIPIPIPTPTPIPQAKAVKEVIQSTPVLDDTALISNPSPALVQSVQNALKTKGYYFGAADGTLGAETMNALFLYQNAHKIGAKGLNNATLKSLGLSPVGQ